MKLSQMRYKEYIWPHNPRTYSIDYDRQIAVNKVPFGQYFLQDVGLTRRVLRGEGEFFGTGAYDEFKRLATVFYDEGPGVLVHPVWMTTTAYFTQLSLRQQPRSDYVAYTFTFWETYGGHRTALELLPERQEENGGLAEPVEDTVFHTVQKGESLWKIARQYGVGLTDLIRRNPQIKNPNLIYEGDRIRVKG